MITVVKYILTILLTIISQAAFCLDSIKISKEIEEKELTTANGVWRYKTSGASDKGILFIHGASSSDDIWKYQYDLDIDNYKNVFLNLLGYGNSDRSKEGYSLKVWINGIHNIVKQEQLSEIIIVGHSNGVIIAKEYYRVYPDSVVQMIFLDGMLKQVLKPEVLEWMHSNLKSPDYMTLVETNIEFMPVAGLNEKDAQLLKQDAHNTPQAVSLAEFEMINNLETWKDLKIKCPVTIVHSNNPIWDEEYVMWLHDTIPKLSFEVWNDSGHFIPLQFPSKLNNLIRRLVKG